MNFNVNFLFFLISLGAHACVPPHEEQEKPLGSSPSQERPTSAPLYYDYPGYSSPVYYYETTEFSQKSRMSASHRQLIPSCSLQK